MPGLPEFAAFLAEVAPQLADKARLVADKLGSDNIDEIIENTEDKVDWRDLHAAPEIEPLLVDEFFKAVILEKSRRKQGLGCGSLPAPVVTRVRRWTGPRQAMQSDLEGASMDLGPQAAVPKGQAGPREAQTAPAADRQSVRQPAPARQEMRRDAAERHREAAERLAAAKALEPELDATQLLAREMIDEDTYIYSRWWTESRDMDHYLFFRQHDERTDPDRAYLSNWYWQKEWHQGADDHWYWCVEQEMMYMKAKTYGDTGKMNRILKSEDAKEMKNLGRAVQGLRRDPERWDRVKFGVVAAAIKKKFEADDGLKRQLLSTGNKVIAEAVNGDDEWAVGFTEFRTPVPDRVLRGVKLDRRTKAWDVPPAEWTGKNLQGLCLMKVRAELRRDEKAKRQSRSSAAR